MNASAAVASVGAVSGTANVGPQTSPMQEQSAEYGAAGGWWRL